MLQPTGSLGTSLALSSDSKPPVPIGLIFSFREPFFDSMQEKVASFCSTLRFYDCFFPSMQKKSTPSLKAKVAEMPRILAIKGRPKSTLTFSKLPSSLFLPRHQQHELSSLYHSHELCSPIFTTSLHRLTPHLSPSSTFSTHHINLLSPPISSSTTLSVGSRMRRDQVSPLCSLHTTTVSLLVFVSESSTLTSLQHHLLSKPLRQSDWLVDSLNDTPIPQAARPARICHLLEHH